MSVLFNPSNIEARSDSGYFTPERLTMIKRVFDAACASANITNKARRDELASRLLIASKTSHGEAALTEFAQKEINRPEPL